MQTITAVIADFSQLAQASDAEIIRRFFLVSRNSRKRLVPKSVAAVAQRVRREPQLLALALFDGKEQQVAEFRFAPIPPFQGLRH